MRPAAWACLAAALALSGCSANPGPGGRDASSSSPGGLAVPPQPQTITVPFTLETGIGTPLLGVTPGGSSRSVFEVPAGYSSLDATVDWDCQNPALCDLQLELRYGESNLQAADFGGSPVTMHVDEPAEGRWTMWAFPDDSGASVVLQMSGTMTVQLA